MNRRDVLKGLGLSMGYMVVTPSVLSILQSCRNETQTLNWKPNFFTIDEGIVIKNLVDLIIPKTDDSPGAVDVNVHKFIDVYLMEVAKEDQQNEYKKGIESILKSIGKPIENISINDYDALLRKFLKAETKIIEQFKKNELENLTLETLKGLRRITVWGYKTSEQIGENVLAYDPVPGVYKGCISLGETTSGKAWAL